MLHIIVHSGENQDIFSKITYISHFQFFPSDGILNCTLAVSRLVGPPAKQDVKQQDKASCCLWKVSEMSVEKTKSSRSSEEVWILGAGGPNGFGFFSSISSQTWESQFYDIWGFFTSAVQTLSSSSDASHRRQDYALRQDFTAPVAVCGSGSLRGDIISWQLNSLHSWWGEVPWCLNLSFQLAKPFTYRWAVSLLSIWEEPWPLSPSLIPIHFGYRLHFTDVGGMSIVGGADNGNLCW